MLGLTIGYGEFVMVGNTVIRVVGTRGGGVRIAVQAPLCTPVVRFNEDGSPADSFYRKVQLTQETAHGIRLTLGCGHIVMVTRGGPVTHLLCTSCRDAAEQAMPKIKELFNQTLADVLKMREQMRVQPTEAAS